MDADFADKFRSCILRMEEIGNKYAEAKGQSWQAQELKYSVIASIISKEFDSLSANKAELLARGSEAYKCYLKETADFIKKENYLKCQYEKEKAVFESLRSLSSLEKKTRDLSE